MTFLQGALANWPRPASEVEAEALAQGISHTTLATARQRLRISSQRQDNRWLWVPPKGRARPTPERRKSPDKIPQDSN